MAILVWRLLLVAPDPVTVRGAADNIGFAVAVDVKRVHVGTALTEFSGMELPGCLAVRFFRLFPPAIRAHDVQPAIAVYVSDAQAVRETEGAGNGFARDRSVFLELGLVSRELVFGPKARRCLHHLFFRGICRIFQTHEPADHLRWDFVFLQSVHGFLGNLECRRDARLADGVYFPGGGSIFAWREPGHLTFVILVLGLPAHDQHALAVAEQIEVLRRLVTGAVPDLALFPQALLLARIFVPVAGRAGEAEDDHARHSVTINIIPPARQAFAVSVLIPLGVVLGGPDLVHFPTRAAKDSRKGNE